MKNKPAPKSAPPANNPIKNAILPSVLWPIIFVSQLIVAALISWQLLYKVDFAYPQAYDAINIDQHIATFGPKNRFRPNFESTDKKQHLKLFSEIGVAIQNNGEGLADISYVTASGRSYKLLRKPEVIHLEDVAKLVNVFYATGYVAIALLIVGTTLAYQQNLSIPKAKHIATGILIFLATIGLTLVIVGPKAVFYWLHIQIFPPEHEWFFYYQESLMTTLMKAPDLFGFIGAVMGAILMVVWILEIVALRLLLSKKNPSQ